MMKKRTMAAIAGILLLAGGASAAYLASPTIHKGNDGEAPELGRTGDYSIGTYSESLPLPDRTEITAWGAISGSLSPVERSVDIRFWYPSATGTSGEPAQYRHDIEYPGEDDVPVSTQGIAIEGAAPLADERFPLVIMSHGYGGWNAHYSNLAEHLASRGYIVASISHGDAPVNGITSFYLSFGNVLADRSHDQRQVYDALMARAENGETRLGNSIDPQKVALIGYSMGGFGALASAGASYVYDGQSMSNLPTAQQEKLTALTAKPLPLKAMIAFAPWGGQPDNRVWSADSLAKINMPVMLVAGNQDDVVNYQEGVRWLFDNIGGADRHLLTYREARHNIVGNDFDVSDTPAFRAAEYLKEPVWRQERLNMINQHFVTAFLDLHVKGEVEKAEYLDVPVPDSNASAWEIGFGEQLNGRFAGPEEKDHWRGFQRRWAVGIDLERKPAGE